MAYTNPVVADFKTQFNRDFPYGGTSGDLTTVQDTDIQNALNEAFFVINPDLFSTQAAYTLYFLSLAAHLMVLNLRASSQGISGQYSFLQASKSVGSVSESFTIPERVLANPELAMLTKTQYGAKYLFYVLPLLSGQVFTVCGGTTP